MCNKNTTAINFIISNLTDVTIPTVNAYKTFLKNQSKHELTSKKIAYSQSHENLIKLGYQALFKYQSSHDLEKTPYYTSSDIKTFNCKSNEELLKLIDSIFLSANAQHIYRIEKPLQLAFLLYFKHYINYPFISQYTLIEQTNKYKEASKFKVTDLAINKETFNHDNPQTRQQFKKEFLLSNHLYSEHIKLLYKDDVLNDFIEFLNQNQQKLIN